MPDKIAEAVIEWFEACNAKQNEFISQGEIVGHFDFDENEVKKWLAFPPNSLSMLLDIGRSRGIKGVFWTPLREARFMITESLRNSEESGEARVEDVKRFMHAWSLLQVGWRREVFAEVNLRYRHAIKSSTARSARVMMTLREAMLTFDPDNRLEGD